jgi:signal transduction histidine kinase
MTSPLSKDLCTLVSIWPTPAFAIGLDDTVRAWNAAATALFGVRPEEAKGRPFRDLKLSSLVPGLQAALDRAKATGAPAAVPDVRVDCAGVDIRATFRLARLDEAGQPVGVLVVVEDRSEVGSLAARLQVALDDLESTSAQLEETNEELRAANEELRASNTELERRLVERHEAQEASRHKDDFLAMLAHELRNPLAAITTALHVMRAHADERQVVRNAGEVVERQVRHQARLLDDLLDVSRITRGKIELRKSAVNLGSVIADAIAATRGVIEARKHTLAFDLAEDPITIEADATRLEQVVANLLTNAAKFSEPGSAITVLAGLEEDRAVIRVRDNGMGIPETMLGRVFDLFTQIDPSLARSQGGLGIGLTLVRSLVQMHGGTVEARSEGPGRGSEFVVRLPLGKPAPAPEEQATTAPRLQPRHILIVEDNDDARQMLRYALELDGHRVETAADGPKGILIAAETRPEVALIDIGLPGLDGYDVARRLRAALGPAILLVALTGYGQAGDRRRAREAGFDAHLVKPLDPEALSGLLRDRPRGRG